MSTTKKRVVTPTRTSSRKTSSKPTRARKPVKAKGPTKVRRTTSSKKRFKTRLMIAALAVCVLCIICIIVVIKVATMPLDTSADEPKELTAYPIVVTDEPEAASTEVVAEAAEETTEEVESTDTTTPTEETVVEEETTTEEVTTTAEVTEVADANETLVMITDSDYMLLSFLQNERVTVSKITASRDGFKVYYVEDASAPTYYYLLQRTHSPLDLSTFEGFESVLSQELENGEYIYVLRQPA